jgi:hypothetical protein
MNWYVDKLFRKWNRVIYFVTVGIIMRMDDERVVVVKENDGGGWSFDDVVLWVRR